MSDDDKSLDLTGVGKLAKAIPAASWNKLVTTACETFEGFIAPVTATTVGIGRYIEAKFDALIEAQKILAAETIRRAQEKVGKANRLPLGSAKPRVVVQVISAWQKMPFFAKNAVVTTRETWGIAAEYR